VPASEVRSRSDPSDVDAGADSPQAGLCGLECRPPRSGIGTEAAEGLIRQGAQVAPMMLTQLVAFAHSVIDGRTAQEIRAARQGCPRNRRNMWACGRVGMPTRARARKVA
jgi:chromosome partitioning protein